MAQASGVEKKLVLAKQAAQGTIAAADAASKIYLRRVTSNFQLDKGSYQSNEIRADRQISDMRHGVQSVSGSINGELSPNTYNLLMSGLLGKDAVAAPASGAESDITAAVTSGNAGTFTSAATATFLQDGLKVGDVVRQTGGTGDAAGNNARNFLITALTDKVITGLMLDGSPVVAAATADALTFTGVGKKIWTPSTGHTEDWFTFEEYHGDLDLSRTWWDCRPASMAVSCKGSGIATINWSIMGLKYTTYATGASPYFTTPAAAATQGVLASANGIIYINDTAVAIVTWFDFTVSGGLSLGEGVVGSSTLSDVFDGRIAVSGNLGAYLADFSLHDLFENENEFRVFLALTTGNTATADFMAITMPRVKFSGASQDDGEKGIIQTLPFTALLNTTGGADTGATATDALTTTISIQDSAIA